MALTLIPPAIGSAAVEVLIIWDTSGDGTPVLEAALAAEGMNVTLSDTNEDSYDGTNPSPTAFDAVIHLNGSSYSYEMPAAGQQALVDYVTNGGGYIGGEWSAHEFSNGRLQDLEDLILLARVSGAETTVTLNREVGYETHPVIANVSSGMAFNGGYNIGYARTFAVDPVTVLMTDTTGNDAVAIREFGAGRVVAFHHANNYSYASYQTLADADILRLYIDAVLWAGDVGNDCDDGNAYVNPGMAEDCANGRDDDCDGITDDYDTDCDGAADDDDSAAGPGGCTCSTAARPSASPLALLALAILAVHRRGRHRGAPGGQP